MIFNRFSLSVLLTVAAVVCAFLFFGLSGAITTVILIAIELAFSFDNAVVNAKILERLSSVWRKLFLTVGTMIAIVGIRFVFPILIVMVTAHLGWGRVIDDALHHPQVYGEHLNSAHPIIAAFGGSFLMALSLYFFFDNVREERWLHRIEHPLQKVRGAAWMPLIITVSTVALVSLVVDHSSSAVLEAGLIGAASYVIMKLVIDGLSKLEPHDKKVHTGWAAFLAFMYLQLLNASFSFDGVLGAFAITDKVFLIVLGLGVGALWASIMTVYFVERGIISTYKYLEHGAHYAIFTLAVALFASLFIEIPDVITGFVGIGIIGASFIASREALKASKA